MMGGEDYGSVENLDWTKYYYDQWTDPEKLVGGASLGVASLKSIMTRASVDDKLARYLLNPDHPVGGPKAKWFQ